MNKSAVMFKNSLIKWLTKNGISNLYVDYEDDFSYAINDEDANIRCINIGVEKVEETGNIFEQFLYEYGCIYSDIPIPVLCFLHEAGHHMTISNFSTIDLLLCDFLKKRIKDEDDFNFYYKYWLVDDEFEANMWMINFINNNIEAVEDLCVLFSQGWNKICSEINPFDLVKEDYYAA